MKSILTALCYKVLLAETNSFYCYTMTLMSDPSKAFHAQDGDWLVPETLTAAACLCNFAKPE